MVEEINRKIKELRQEKGMTLKDVSAVTELSVSFISQVERGTTSLTITSLKKIADAFGVNMAYFFEEDTTNHNYVLKKENQKPFKIEGSNLIYCRLNGEFTNRTLEPLLVTLQPKQKQAQTFSHPGEEFYYVLRGGIIFYINGGEYYVKEGDSIHFPSQQEHYWENPSSEDATVLCVLTPALF